MTKFRKFEPATQAAAVKVTELLQRGGEIIRESRERVEIRRMQSIATIDSYGRVEWREDTTTHKR